MGKYITPSHRRAQRLKLQEEKHSSGLLFASISVSQPQGPEIEYMNVCITDEASGRQILELKISHEDLMRAITSREAMGVLKLYEENLSVIGKEKQIKYERVKVPENYYSAGEAEFIGLLGAVCKAYEVDGWESRLSGWKSSKKTLEIDKDSGSTTTQVTFVRYV